MQVEWWRFEALPSTSAYAKERAKEMPADKLVVVWARKQTDGHGQFGRKWVAGEGNLTATFCFSVPLGWEKLGQSALEVSKSVGALVRELGVECEFKWPNDILVGGSKLAGVLCETVVVGERMVVCAGVGLNVRGEIEGVDQPVTSLAEQGVEVECEVLVERLAERLNSDLALFLPNP